MRANISAALPTVTTDDKLSCVTTPMVKVGDPPSSRQGDDSDGAQGSRTRTQVFPEAQVPHALRELEGLRGQVLSANKVLVNQCMKRARWSLGAERPDLQDIDEVRPIRHGKQWSEQASRTTIRRPSQLDNGKFGNMRSTLGCHSLKTNHTRRPQKHEKRRRKNVPSAPRYV